MVNQSTRALMMDYPSRNMSKDSTNLKPIMESKRESMKTTSIIASSQDRQSEVYTKSTEQNVFPRRAWIILISFMDI